MTEFRMLSSERRGRKQVPIAVQSDMGGEPYRGEVELVGGELDRLEHDPDNREQHQHAASTSNRRQEGTCLTSSRAFDRRRLTRR